MYKALESFKPLFKYKYFFFDCDGVLWHEGKELFNAFRILRLLQEAKKEVFLLSNNSTQSRASGAEYIRSRFGFSLDPERYCSSAFLAGHYAKAKAYKSLYVIGAQPLFDELELSLANPEFIGKEDSRKMGLDAEFYQRLNTNKVDAVIVGKDDKVNYYKIAYAVCSVNKGAELVATHRDLMFRSQGVQIPNTGTTVKAIEAATRKKAINLGKPEDYGIKVLCQKFGIDLKKERENMLIVGDNVGVEIKLGKTLGIDSLLVFSGSTTKENFTQELERDKGVTPTYVIPYLTYHL